MLWGHQVNQHLATGKRKNQLALSACCSNLFLHCCHIVEDGWMKKQPCTRTDKEESLAAKANSAWILPTNSSSPHCKQKFIYIKTDMNIIILAREHQYSIDGCAAMVLVRLPPFLAARCTFQLFKCSPARQSQLHKVWALRLFMMPKMFFLEMFTFILHNIGSFLM